jgi:Protein of unknown function (DUF3431)
MVKRLSVERVMRVGYMNLRCTLTHGCPSHLHPTNPVENRLRPEDIFWPKAWKELFPDRPVPHTVSQSCCGQFAVSRDHILKTPRTEYRRFRDWLINTKLEDRISGRIWEYMWQILFTGEYEFCPPEHICLCDGYGMCFGSGQEYDDWRNKQAYLGNLKSYRRKIKEDVSRLEEEISRLEEVISPLEEAISRLEEEISQLEEEISAEKARAFQRGEDPRLRAIEVSQQCLAPNSDSEWNNAAVSWLQSAACLGQQHPAAETWEGGD